VDSSPEPSAASASVDASAGGSEQPSEAPSVRLEQDPAGTPDRVQPQADADESSDGAEEGTHAESDAASATVGDAGDKKKRRRRRRKKPASAAPVPGDEAQANGADGTSEPGAETASDAPHAGEAHERRREKRHGPPRERAPVTLGDIVFGKIIDITEEAILVDIPGKAKAIFDRRELLLPDEEDERETGRPPPVDAAPPPATPAAGTDETSQVATEAAPAAAAPVDVATEGSGVAAVAVAPVDSPELAAASAATAKDAVVAEPEAVEPPQAVADADDAGPREVDAGPREVDAGPREVDAGPREVKDPKVPHVVLEVGADFIGVVHCDGGRGGLVVLTHHPRRAEKAKVVLEKAFGDASLVLGLVTGVIKGGIEVDVDGLRAFAPGSHVDLHMGADLSYLVGQRLPFVVTQYAKRGRDVVLSRKAIIEEEARKARTEALARLKVGEELEGVVRSVVPFGAFVDLGGIEGLVPLQEMSHNRGDGPSDVFKAGEPTRVKVIKIDDKGKVWLSHKATVPDPWQRVAEKYAQGTRHTGKVVRLQPFGAFVELESGIDGLIHTQDLSAKRIDSPEEVVKVGDAIEVVVAYVEPLQHKIALHPAPQGEAAGEAPQRVVPHKAVKAKVLAIESGGLVVRILGVTGRSARGYVTAAGTGTPRGTELRKAFNVGQDVEAKVIEIDPRRGEVKLSIKALSEDQERNAYQQYRQQLKAEAKFTFGDLLAKKGSPSR
jgi:small subunit ribosomal protein S1